MSKKVLLVDDSRFARAMLKGILENLGHMVVCEANNGELGFEAYKEFMPDIVLSDVEMPVLDGYGMLKKIIAYDSDAIIVMITSVANAQIIQKIKSAGAKGALKKPLDTQMLEKLFKQLN